MAREMTGLGAVVVRNEDGRELAIEGAGEAERTDAVAGADERREGVD